MVSRNPWQVQAIPFGSRFSQDLLKEQRLRLICYADIQYWRYVVLYRCWWVSSLDDRSNTSNAKHLSPSFKVLYLNLHVLNNCCWRSTILVLCIEPTRMPTFREAFLVWDVYSMCIICVLLHIVVSIIQFSVSIIQFSVSIIQFSVSIIQFSVSIMDF